MKYCSGCKQNLSLDMFWKNKAKKDGLHNYCKICHKRYWASRDIKRRFKYRNDINYRKLVNDKSKTYYYEHQNAVKNQVKEHRIEKFQKIIEYLKIHPCVDCGNPDIRVLEFDHVRGKKRDCVPAIARKCSWENTLKEIAKCEVRCANCHKIRHYQDWIK